MTHVGNNLHNLKFQHTNVFAFTLLTFVWMFVNHKHIIGIWVQSITQQVYLTMFIEDENITTCFGLIRPSSGLHPKGIRDL